MNVVRYAYLGILVFFGRDDLSWVFVSSLVSILIFAICKLNRTRQERNNTILSISSILWSFLAFDATFPSISLQTVSLIVLFQKRQLPLWAIYTGRPGTSSAT